MRDGGAKTSRFRLAEINKIRDTVNSKGREKQREDLVRLIYRTCSLDRCIIILLSSTSRQYLLETIPPPLEARPSHSNENFALVTGLKKGPAA